MASDGSKNVEPPASTVIDGIREQKKKIWWLFWEYSATAVDIGKQVSWCLVLEDV